MMFSRIVAMAASAAVVVLFLGCGEKPVFDPATAYSPESLALELSFRYKTIDRKEDDAVQDPGAVTKSGVTKGGGAATKQAGTQTFRGLIEDISGKIGRIPGISRAEVAKKVVGLVSKDPSIPGADRKTIADKLTQASAG
jgi:hypothetical protein